MADWCCLVYACHGSFVRPSVDGHLGCFRVLAALTRTAADDGSSSVWASSECMPRGGIAGLNGGFAKSQTRLGD